MAKEQKTNAMRILDSAKIPYAVCTYDHSDGRIDGVSVAEKTGFPLEMVYKTLVTQGAGRNFYVFVIPVDCELDLKKAARTVGEKSVQMIHVADLNRCTGYIRGGCSPVGMKKLYPTVFHSSVEKQQCIAVSGGRIGTQIRTDPQALITLLGAKTADLIMAS